MSETADRVKKIVVEHLGVEADKVTEEASFIDDLGADSLDIVELVMAFEEEFGVEIPDDAAEKITTVKDAIDDLAGARLVASPDSPRFKSGVYGVAKSPYAKLMREGIADGAIPDSHRMTVHGDTVRSLYELAHRTQTPGRLSKEFLLENGTKKDKKVLLDSAAVVATITTHPDEYIHYKYARNITVREMARLQSFPDRFTFHGRYTINGPRRRFDVARCSQVGNAVPPLMGEGLGRAVIEVLEKVAASRPTGQPAPAKVDA